ncbi:MAG: metallophosphoesterase [Gemmatimonadota bacterium]|nr:metallophosphoesterase [Gemmatimonadota bacterium]
MASVREPTSPHGALRRIRPNPKHPYNAFVFFTRRIWSVVLIGLVLACSRDEGATPRGKLLQELALPGAPVMIGAGDIAVCGTSGDEATGRLVDSLLRVDSVTQVISAVFTLGDNAYPSGAGGVDNDLPRCFSPSWGAGRIMRLIHPAPGNHDYDSGSGAPYFAYFGQRAGPRGKGYYSYDIGEWHVVSLNSELYFERASASEARQQERWLRQDLTDHPALCTLAYFHRPLFSSGDYGATPQVRLLWNILYGGGVDIVLNGHEHHYERFLPQSPSGVADSIRGIEQIIVGTGGGQLRGVRSTLAPNSIVQVHGHFGVLKLTLGTGEYRDAFLGTDGLVWDTGAGNCH